MIEKNNFTFSNFVSTALLNKNIEEHIEISYIKPIVDNFFKKRNISEYIEIKSKNAISDLDFPSIEFSYFYNELFFDIKRNHQGEIDLKPKFVISFDKNLCTKFCKKTSTYYQEITAHKVTLAYFIFIDFHELTIQVRKTK